MHLTTVHPPNDGRIFHKEACSLARAGYDVTLIAPGAADEDGGPVTMISVPVSSGNRIRRALSGNWRLLRLLQTQRADVYHFHDPELIPVGIVLGTLRKRVIYDAHEHVGDTIRNKASIPRPLRGPLRLVVGSLERLMVRLAAQVVAATPPIGSQFPRSRTTVIHNYPIIEDAPDSDFEESQYLSRPLTGAYIGIMTSDRKSPEMFKACDDVARSQPQFRLIAAGRPNGVGDPSDHEGVDYRGILPRAQALGLLADTRLGIMLLGAGPNGTEAMPTKFFEYCAAGLPVIVSKSTENIARIVQDTDCGLLVDETSIESIASAIRVLLNDPHRAYAMGQRGAAAVRDQYRWESEGLRLTEMYRDIVGPPTIPR